MWDVISLAQVIQSATASASSETVYYILGSMALVLAAVTTTWRYFLRQRKRWIDEGQLRAQQQLAIEENNKSLQGNTDAIAKLTVRMDDIFHNIRSDIQKLSAQVGTQGDRITRLEDSSRIRRYLRETKGMEDSP